MSSQIRTQRGNDFTKEDLGVNICDKAADDDFCAGRSLPYHLGTEWFSSLQSRRKAAIFCQKDPLAHKSCLFTYTLKSALIYSVEKGIYSAFQISYPVCL